jgi:hypothetical protein
MVRGEGKAMSGTQWQGLVADGVEFVPKTVYIGVLKRWTQAQQFLQLLHDSDYEPTVDLCNSVEDLLAGVEPVLLVDPGPYQDHIQRSGLELARLTDKLHSLSAHPDFEYLTSTCARKQYEGRPDLVAEGWESNVTGGDPHSCWERFEYHENHYWRRKKP